MASSVPQSGCAGQDTCGSRACQKHRSNHQPNTDTSCLSVDDRIRTVYLCFRMRRPTELLLRELKEEPFPPAVRGWFWDVLAVAHPKVLHQPSGWCLALVTKPWKFSIWLLFWEPSDLEGCDSLNRLSTQPLHPALQALVQMGFTGLPYRPEYRRVASPGGWGQRSWNGGQILVRGAGPF